MASKPVAHRMGKKWRSEDVKLQEVADFTSLLLTDSVLAGLEKSGFKTPSPIQLEAIPVGRFGKDLVVQAKSGTGKTLVFTIVALDMLLDVKHPQVLILAPTREIAFQICSVIQAVGSELKDLKCCTFIGGTSINEDKNRAHNCQIAVGTPGRIKQLINLGILKTNSIRLFVLDEADQLLAESFQSDVDDIFLTLPKDKQVIAASATYPKKLKKLVDRYFRKPYLARLSVNELALLGIIHYTYLVDTTDMVVLSYKQKLKCLEKILTTVSFSQCLVFCNMISRVQQLSSDIKKWGFSTTYISSAKEQSERLKAIDNLKRFKCKVLVSSDLTARGIDAENVDLVINFDAPNYTDVYLHRSGRAGRYGSKGVSITFVNETELKTFQTAESVGNFKSYELPDPIPENLINIRPKEFFEKAVIERISSDNSEGQSAEDSMLKENDVDNSDKTNEDTSENSDIRILVPNGVLKSGMEERIDQNVPLNLSQFEVKLPSNEVDPVLLSPKNLVESPNFSTGSAISQFSSENTIEVRLEDIFPSVIKKCLIEPIIGSKSKEEGKMNTTQKSNPEDKIGDAPKTMEDFDKSWSTKNHVIDTSRDFSSILSNLEHTEESGDENFREMDSAISNFIVHHERNLVSKVPGDLSLNRNIDSQDASSSNVIADESSSKKSVCTKDIAQLRNGLNNYYYTVLTNYTDECVHQVNVTEEEVETEKFNTPIGKTPTHDKPLLQKQPKTTNSVDEYHSAEETESSSEIESYLESTGTKHEGDVIFSAKSIDESSASSSSSCEASSSLECSKKLNLSMEEIESTLKIQSCLESTPKRNKGEVIYTANSTNESSDSSSSLDSEPLKSVLLLRKKFKEMVEDSYKKQPPRNECMPKLSKSICKQVAPSTDEHPDLAQGAVFISSSGSSTTSEASREASSESSSDSDTNEIQRPKQRRVQKASSAYSKSTNASKHSSKPKPMPRGNKKSQSGHTSIPKESCNLTKSNDVYINNRHHVSRSNQGTYNAGHGNLQSADLTTRESQFYRSQYANQLPNNCDIGYRPNWATYNTRDRNLQSTNYIGNSHCGCQSVNHSSYNTCTWAYPNQSHIPHENLNYQPHLYNQWYEIFQKQWQCIHYSTYFR